MRIYLNDQEYTIETESNLDSFFTKLNIDVSKGVAVAVNSAVVPKSSWPKFGLTNEDKIILIKATQGG